MPAPMRKSLPILFLAIFASMLGMGVVVPLLPLYAESMGASGVGLGMIVSGFSLARTIVMPAAGRFSDLRGRKRILAVGLLFYTLTSVGYVWATNVLSLSLIRFLQGIASGMIMPVAQAYVGDVSPLKEEGKWMGYFNAAMFGGFGVGPLMGGTVTEHLGMNVTFYIMAGLNLISFLLVVAFLPEVSRQKLEQVTPHGRISTSSTLRGLFSYQLSFAVGRGTFTVFLPVFAGVRAGLSPSLVGVLVAFSLLFMSILQVYGGHIADRIDRKLLVIVGNLLTTISLALVPWTSGFWTLLGVCALGGIGGGASMPAASALGIAEGRKFGMAWTIASLAMAFSIGMTIGPVLAGAIDDWMSINETFYFAAVIGLLGTGLCAWLIRGGAAERLT